MKKNNWLVVADASLARIFEIENHSSIVEIAKLEHPESRLHNMDLVTDKPGREFSRVGGNRSAIESSITPKKHEFELFAREVVKFLEKAYNDNKFGGFYLAAGPEFLGLVRSQLTSELKKVVLGEINKALTDLDSKEILVHMQF